MTDHSALRILWLSRYGPDRPFGGSLRLQHLVQGALEAGHSVTLLCGDSGVDRSVDPRRGRLQVRALESARRPRLIEAPLAALSRLPTTAWAAQRLTGLRAEVAGALLGHDLVIINQLDAMAMLPRWLPLPLIVDLHNIESELFADMASRAPSAIAALRYRLDARKARALEDRTTWDVRQLWLCSLVDADVMRARSDVPCHVVPNGASIPVVPGATVPYSERPPRLLCVASWNHPPNRDAGTWLLEQVWPVVAAARPDAELCLVGREAERLLSQTSAAPGRVTLHADVASVAPFYDEARVALAPLRYGGGTKLKVLEAMAYGVPVVTTTEGVRGLLPGAPVRLADTVTSTAGQIISLLDDAGAAEDLARRARQWTEENYAWPLVQKRVGALLNEWR